MSLEPRTTRLLTLMRHGKAESPSSAPSDRERALASRGERDAKAIAERAKLGERPPGRVLFSTARRTRETADCVREAVSLDVGLFVGSDRLYLASLDTLLKIIAEQDRSGIDHLMIIGHNPGLEDLALHFDAGLDPAAWSMSTSTLCRFARPVDGAVRLLLEERPAPR